MDFAHIIQTVLVGGFATTIAVQILKSALIPVAFQNYKRLTAFAVSVVAAWLAEVQGGLNLSLVHQPLQWATVVLGTFFVAIVTYNNLRPTQPVEAPKV